MFSTFAYLQTKHFIQNKQDQNSTNASAGKRCETSFYSRAKHREQLPLCPQHGNCYFLASTASCSDNAEERDCSVSIEEFVGVFDIISWLWRSYSNPFSVSRGIWFCSVSSADASWHLPLTPGFPFSIFCVCV